MKKKIMLFITIISFCFLFASCKNEQYIVLQNAADFSYAFEIFIPKYVEKNGSKADIPIDAVIGWENSLIFAELFHNNGEVELEVITTTEKGEEDIKFNKFPYLEWRGREHKKFNLPLSSNHGWIEIYYRVHCINLNYKRKQFYLIAFKTVEKRNKIFYEFNLKDYPKAII